MDKNNFFRFITGLSLFALVGCSPQKGEMGPQGLVGEKGVPGSTGAQGAMGLQGSGGETVTSGGASGGGGFGDVTSYSLQKLVMKDLNLLVDRVAPEAFKPYGANWQKEQIAEVLKNIEWSPDVSDQRSDGNRTRDLKFTYGYRDIDEKKKPFIQALDMYYQVYAGQPISTMDYKELGKLKLHIMQDIFWELGHLVLGHPVGNLSPEQVEKIENEAKEFSQNLMKVMLAQFMLCTPLDPMGNSLDQRFFRRGSDFFWKHYYGRKEVIGNNLPLMLLSTSNKVPKGFFQFRINRKTKVIEALNTLRSFDFSDLSIRSSVLYPDESSTFDIPNFGFLDLFEKKQTDLTRKILDLRNVDLRKGSFEKVPSGYTFGLEGLNDIPHVDQVRYVRVSDAVFKIFDKTEEEIKRLNKKSRDMVAFDRTNGAFTIDEFDPLADMPQVVNIHTNIQARFSHWSDQETMKTVRNVRVYLDELEKLHPGSVEKAAEDVTVYKDQYRRRKEDSVTKPGLTYRAKFSVSIPYQCTPFIPKIND